MSFNPVGAFKTVLRMQEISAVLSRRGEIADTNIKVAPSNYFRDFDTLEEIPISGNEFVIDKDRLAGTNFEADGPKRGDTLVTDAHGVTTVDEIRPMLILGTLVGYRIRTTK